MCVFTLQQGGYEGCGHTAGAQQHSVAHLKLPLWDPPQNYGSHGSQEPHHGGLYLGGRGDVLRKQQAIENKTMRMNYAWMTNRQGISFSIPGSAHSCWVCKCERTCFNARFPMMRFHFSIGESIFPTFTCVRQEKRGL